MGRADRAIPAEWQSRIFQPGKLWGISESAWNQLGGDEHNAQRILWFMKLMFQDGQYPVPSRAVSGYGMLWKQTPEGMVVSQQSSIDRSWPVPAVNWAELKIKGGTTDRIRRRYENRMQNVRKWLFDHNVVRYAEVDSRLKTPEATLEFVGGYRDVPTIKLQSSPAYQRAKETTGLAAMMMAPKLMQAKGYVSASVAAAQQQAQKLAAQEEATGVGRIRALAQEINSALSSMISAPTLEVGQTFAAKIPPLVTELRRWVAGGKPAAIPENEWLTIMSTVTSAQDAVSTYFEAAGALTAPPPSRNLLIAGGALVLAGGAAWFLLRRK